jgi:hypothetical protein
LVSRRALHVVNERHRGATGGSDELAIFANTFDLTESCARVESLWTGDRLLVPNRQRLDKASQIILFVDAAWAECAPHVSRFQHASKLGKGI